MNNNFEADITKMVSDITEVPVSKLKPNADFFKDLGIDSLKAIEIIAALERKYRIIIPENDIPNIRNLKKIIEYFEPIASVNA